MPVTPSEQRETRRCRYCKAEFEVDPKFVHKQFCKESHRKLYWKYGSQSIGKVAERMKREIERSIESELAPLRARLDSIENRLEVQ